MSDHLGFPHQPGVAEDTEAQNVETFGSDQQAAGDTITDDDLDDDLIADLDDDDDDPDNLYEDDEDDQPESSELPF